VGLTGWYGEDRGEETSQALNKSKSAFQDVRSTMPDCMVGYR